MIHIFTKSGTVFFDESGVGVHYRDFCLSHGPSRGHTSAAVVLNLLVLYIVSEERDWPCTEHTPRLTTLANEYCPALCPPCQTYESPTEGIFGIEPAGQHRCCRATDPGFWFLSFHLPYLSTSSKFQSIIYLVSSGNGKVSDVKALWRTNVFWKPIHPPAQHGLEIQVDDCRHPMNNFLSPLKPKRIVPIERCVRTSHTGVLTRLEGPVIFQILCAISATSLPQVSGLWCRSYVVGQISLYAMAWHLYY